MAWMRAVCGVVACCAMALGAGCNVVGAVGYAAMGPPKVTAQYKPAAVPTLVFVENFQAPSGVAVDADVLGTLVARELAANGVAPVVGPEKLFALRERKGTEFGQMRVSEVGRAVGAEQVLYVELLRSDVEESAGDLMKAGLSARVKLVDAKTGATLWPGDTAEGFPVQYETPITKREGDVTATAVRETMLQTMARRTARLFYDWKPENLKQAAEG